LQRIFIQYLDSPASVFDKAGCLRRVRNNGDACAPRPEHLRQLFLREQQRQSLDSRGELGNTQLTVVPVSNGLLVPHQQVRTSQRDRLQRLGIAHQCIAARLDDTPAQYNLPSGAANAPSTPSLPTIPAKIVRGLCQYLT